MCFLVKFVYIQVTACIELLILLKNSASGSLENSREIGDGSLMKHPPTLGFNTTLKYVEKKKHNYPTRSLHLDHILYPGLECA